MDPEPADQPPRVALGPQAEQINQAAVFALTGTFVASLILILASFIASGAGVRGRGAA